MKEQENSEAIVHFELYRLIKNNLSVSESDLVKYSDIEPERGVKTGSVDLVVKAKTETEPIDFLAIEVKKPDRRSYWLYVESSEKQIRRYARELQSSYSALTDGQVLRLFVLNRSNQEITHLGDYHIQLEDDQIRHFLSELLKLYENKQAKIGLSQAPSLDLKKFEREIKGLTEALVNAFDQLGNQAGFKLENKPDKRYINKKLSFNSFSEVLTLSVEREKTDPAKDTSFIYLKLSDLRYKLGSETLSDLLSRLKGIPCFEWIKPRNAERDVGSTWKNLRDINLREEASAEDLKQKLTEWFQELQSLATA